MVTVSCLFRKEQKATTSSSSSCKGLQIRGGNPRCFNSLFCVQLMFDCARYITAKRPARVTVAALDRPTSTTTSAGADSTKKHSLSHTLTNLRKTDFATHATKVWRNKWDLQKSHHVGFSNRGDLVTQSPDQPMGRGCRRWQKQPQLAAEGGVPHLSLTQNTVFVVALRRGCIYQIGDDNACGRGRAKRKLSFSSERKRRKGVEKKLSDVSNRTVQYENEKILLSIFFLPPSPPSSPFLFYSR